MVLTLIVNAVLTLLLPAFAGIVVWLSRVLAQNLPDHQAPRLEQFARLAVRQVEQQYTQNPGKKNLAVVTVKELFNAFQLPLPPDAAIAIAIEAAVYDLGPSRKAEK